MYRYLRIPAILLVVFFLAGPAAADPLDDLEIAFKAQREGNYDEAIRHYTSLLKTKRLKARQRAVAYLLRGEAKKKKGDCQSAVSDFSRAVRIRKDYAQAYYFRGTCLEQLDRLDEAADDLKRAIQLRPERDAYKNRLARVEARMEKSPKKAPDTDEPEAEAEKVAPENSKKE